MNNQLTHQFAIHQQQPPVVYPQNYGAPTKSCCLTGIGITLILLTLAAAGLAIYAISFSVNPSFAYANLACAAFFFITGYLAVKGGNNVGLRQSMIVGSMVLGIFGVITAVVGIITNVLAILWFGRNCHLCDFSISITNVEVGCKATCIVAYLPVHIALAALTVLCALFGIIVSYSACCNVCSCCCCYEVPSGGGFVVSPPPLSTTIVQMQQPSVPYRHLEEERQFQQYAQPPQPEYNPDFEYNVAK